MQRNSIMSQLVVNGRSPNQDKAFSHPFKLVIAERWQAPSIDTNLMATFADQPLVLTTHQLQPNKALGLDNIHKFVSQ